MATPDSQARRGNRVGTLPAVSIVMAAGGFLLAWLMGEARVSETETACQEKAVVVQKQVSQRVQNHVDLLTRLDESIAKRQLLAAEGRLYRAALALEQRELATAAKHMESAAGLLESLRTGGNTTRIEEVRGQITRWDSAATRDLPSRKRHILTLAEQLQSAYVLLRSDHSRERARPPHSL